MIVRSSFKCATCGQIHTLRIGMGHEARQTHCFPCVLCGEDMVVALNVDFEKIAHWVEAVDNAEHAAEEGGAPIVNVDANFFIPEEERHKDRVFPRVTQLRAMIDAAESRGSLISLANIPEGMFEQRPYRRSDYADEWRLLKKAWSLHRRAQDHLVQRKIAAASDQLYKSDPLDGLLDWLWRFVLSIGQPNYESPFRAAFAVARPLMRTSGFTEFADWYNKVARDRGERYFELMKAYFESYDDFGQVHFHVVTGIEVPQANVASSGDFDATRMFYGNAFEAFASSVDILAYLNNLKAGRHFNQFAELTQEGYLKLDKASRFSAFAAVPEFIAICEERDNQIRNASHHGGMRMDRETQRIHCRAGKGGTGQPLQISYVTYLARSAKLFLQAMTLLRLEIMMSHGIGMRPPL